MSAQEFGEWKVMFACEGLHPGVERQRHAQLLASLANGVRVHPHGRKWVAEDYDPGDRWQALGAELEPPKPVTREQRRAQVAAINKLIQR